MEQMLELRLKDDHPRISENTLHFVDADPVWHPSQARGIYGGVLISQSLVAAQRSVKLMHTVRSMRCNFLKSGSNTQPLLYEAQRLHSDHDAIVTVRVVVRQSDSLIFTTTVQFSSATSDRRTQRPLEPTHPASPPPPDSEAQEEDDEDDISRPFLHEQIVANPSNSNTNSLKKRSWLRSRSPITQRDSSQTHLAVLAFLSDSYVIRTLPQALGLRILQHRKLRKGEMLTIHNTNTPPATVSMMVSLDHVIHFHRLDFRADEWIYAEMEADWASHGRALVRERMYTPSGVLVATCVQEGVVRLEQEHEVAKI